MSANLADKFVHKLNSKEYRDAYAAESVRMGIAYQIRALEPPPPKWSTLR
jgi:hypothetical protein